MNPDRALLGAVLYGCGDLDELGAIVSPGDFREPRDETVWNAIIRVSESGTKPDPVTVRMAIGGDGWRLLKDHGGPVYLADLVHECPNPLHVNEYAEQVADNAGRRNLAVALHAVSEDLKDTDRPWPEIAEQARSRIDDATLRVTTGQPIRIGDVVEEVLDIAEHGAVKGLPTPWPDLDRLTGGLAPGRLVVVGARPGVGKSVMGTNLALDVAHRHGHEVLLCSLEMPRVEVTQRVIAAHVPVSLSSLEKGNVEPSVWDRIAPRVTDVQELPITIEDAATQTVASIRVATRAAVKAAAARDRKLALVVVDYLQLLTARDRRVPRHEQVGEMSSGLKQIAREYGVCVVAMAQLNRASIQRHGGRPTIADLRESGSIEADADIVLLLHRPDDDNPDVEVLVAKNRAGPRGEANLQLQGHYARLVTGDRSWQAGGVA